LLLKRNKREEETLKRHKTELIINEKPRKKAEYSSKLYFPDRNTPSTRKNNRRTQKDGDHKICKLISKQPSAHHV